MKWLLLPLLLLSSSAFGQERFEVDTVVKGRVYAERFQKVILLQAKLWVVGTDGTSIETFTNDSGEYFFTNSQIFPNNSFVITASSLNYEEGSRFLSRTGKFTTVGIKEMDLPMVKDFRVDLHVPCSVGNPNISFSRNTAEIESYAAELLDGLEETLIDNPTLVIEIGGRASFDEMNARELAEARAELVKEELIKRHIDEERLVLANYLDTVYHVANWSNAEFGYQDTLNPAYVSKLTDPELVELARKLNSSIQFKVIRTDHVPKN